MRHGNRKKNIPEGNSEIISDELFSNDREIYRRINIVEINKNCKNSIPKKGLILQSKLKAWSCCTPIRNDRNFELTITFK